MGIKVYIPFYLRHYTNGADAIEVDGTTVEECLRQVTQEFPELYRVLFPDDHLDDFISIVVNDEIITAGDEPLTRPVASGDQISLSFLLAGG